DAVRAQALAVGAVDCAFASLDEAVYDADLVVLCTPVLTIPVLVSQLLGMLKPGCLLTDVGSTKQWLTNEILNVLEGRSVTYIGSHPMAGSEKTGIEASRADLYLGACVLVTPMRETDANAVAQLTTFWQSVGAIVTTVTPEEHDIIIARTSHLPHLTAALLMNTVDRDGRNVAPFCGPGFRDTTRIAAGSEDVWHDIVKSNATAIRRELDMLRRGIDSLCEQLDRKDFEAVREWLACCRLKREAFCNKGQGGE
ncbi:MAG TPA: prephenate dehydrogenase/arogenate dehydrogenase family protein, partial [Verrucomicrobia bacterium]|nr:prephenate dehydrogenase/arogenate dehydrogenase family protein [Verrucomicrobiota bacterium]